MRGSGYIVDEDASLAQAWVGTNENPVVGTDQTGDAFHTALCARYNAIRPTEKDARSVESSMSRFKVMKREVDKISGYYWAVKRSKPRGFSE